MAGTFEDLRSRISCESCFRRHTLCDRNEPCGRCEKLKLRCVPRYSYIYISRANGKGKRPSNRRPSSPQTGEPGALGPSSTLPESVPVRNSSEPGRDAASSSSPSGRPRTGQDQATAPLRALAGHTREHGLLAGPDRAFSNRFVAHVLSLRSGSQETAGGQAKTGLGDVADRLQFLCQNPGLVRTLSDDQLRSLFATWARVILEESCDTKPTSVKGHGDGGQETGMFAPFGPHHHAATPQQNQPSAGRAPTSQPYTTEHQRPHPDPAVPSAAKPPSVVPSQTAAQAAGAYCLRRRSASGTPEELPQQKRQRAAGHEQRDTVSRDLSDRNASGLPPNTLVLPPVNPPRFRDWASHQVPAYATQLPAIRLVVPLDAASATAWYSNAGGAERDATSAGSNVLVGQSTVERPGTER
ncbi:hypothetical protein VTH06DRAFT_8707 [Thermothelomyces fergusii]